MESSWETVDLPFPALLPVLAPAPVVDVVCSGVPPPLSPSGRHTTSLSPSLRPVLNLEKKKKNRAFKDRVHALLSAPEFYC